VHSQAIYRHVTFTI